MLPVIAADNYVPLSSIGWCTTGKERSIELQDDGRLFATVDFEAEKNINCFMFSNDYPGYLPGQGRPYALQIKQADGICKTVNKGNIFGAIKAVRVLVKATGIQQLDVF